MEALLRAASGPRGQNGRPSRGWRGVLGGSSGAQWEGRSCHEEAGWLWATEGHPGGRPESLPEGEEEEGHGEDDSGVPESPLGPEARLLYFLPGRKGSLALTHTPRLEPRGERVTGGAGQGKSPLSSGSCILDPKHLGVDPGLPAPLAVGACGLPWRPGRQKGSWPRAPPACALRSGAGAAPRSLPPLDDGYDIVHLDMQLVRFLKVLKGPHIRGLCLEAETGHCLFWDDPTLLPLPPRADRPSPPAGSPSGPQRWVCPPACEPSTGP